MRFYISLSFKCHLVARVFAWSCADTFCNESEGSVPAGWEGNFHKLFNDAAFYFMVVGAMEPLGKHLHFSVGNELSEASVEAYDRFVHRNVFPPADPGSVTAVVGDGHKKICVACNRFRVTSENAGAGMPAEGWFMLVNPSSGRILAVTPMKTPEDNAVVTTALLKLLPAYHNINLLVMDRVCGYMPSAAQNPLLRQLKYYSVEWLHAKGAHRRVRVQPLLHQASRPATRQPQHVCVRADL